MIKSREYACDGTDAPDGTAPNYAVTDRSGGVVNETGSHSRIGYRKACISSAWGDCFRRDSVAEKAGAISTSGINFSALLSSGDGSLRRQPLCQVARLEHDVKLIARTYVRPFVKRQKNDAADTETIWEAAQRPTIRFVAVKSEEMQAAAVLFRVRDLLATHSDHQWLARTSD